MFFPPPPLLGSPSRSSGSLRAAIIAGLVLGVVVVGVVESVSRLVSDSTPAPTARFTPGDAVQFRLTGTPAMVLRVFCRTRRGACHYSVRVAAPQSRTSTSVLGADGPIKNTPVALVHGVWEYELESSE